MDQESALGTAHAVANCIDDFTNEEDAIPLQIRYAIILLVTKLLGIPPHHHHRHHQLTVNIHYHSPEVSPILK